MRQRLSYSTSRLTLRSLEGSMDEKGCLVTPLRVMAHATVIDR